MADEQLNKQIAALEDAGKKRYGEHWDTSVAAISRAIGPGGIPEAGFREILKQTDPTRTIYDCGKEALLQASDNGDHDAERAYRQIRQHEREQHRKGR
jgi:hypothetical protein